MLCEYNANYIYVLLVTYILRKQNSVSQRQFSSYNLEWLDFKFDARNVFNQIKFQIAFELNRFTW